MARSKSRSTCRQASQVCYVFLLWALQVQKVHTRARAHTHTHTHCREREKLRGLEQVWCNTLEILLECYHDISFTSIYVSSYYDICVLVLLHMCPHTATYASSYYYIDSIETHPEMQYTAKASETSGRYSCSRMLTYAHVC
jgi:hypothetical protein